jgi:hypothetical protein
MAMLVTFAVDIRSRLYRIDGEWAENEQTCSTAEAGFEGGYLPLYDICYLMS